MSGATHIMQVRIDNGVPIYSFRCLNAGLPHAERDCAMYDHESGTGPLPGCAVEEWFDALGHEFVEDSLHGVIDVGIVPLVVTEFTFDGMKLEGCGG